MDEMRQKLREHQAAIRFAAWRPAFCATYLADPAKVSRLDLAATGRLMSAAVAAMSDRATTRFFETEQLDVLLAEIAKAIPGMFGDSVMLLHPQSDEMGAAVIPTPRSEAALQDLWTAAGGELFITTESGRPGVCVEQSLYDEAGVHRPEGIIEANRWC